MQNLAQALQQSLSPNPAERRQAERDLDALKQPGFAQLVLELAQSGGAPLAVRQAAALLFKNYIRAGWPVDDENPAAFPVPESDRSALKSGIVPVMIQLSSLPNLQVQVGEAIAVMAEHDFPLEWPNLVNQLIASFSQDDFIVNNGVLQTAHAIFRRWRSQFRSDALFTEIKYVLEVFCEPFMALFKRTDELLSQPAALPSPQDPKTLSRTLLLLLQIFYDLNSQDLPEFFEDNITACMTLLHKYLTWTRPELQSQDDDDEEEAEAGPLEKIRASICEIAQLYTQQYLDAFTMMEKFVETTWTLVTGLGKSTKYDTLISKAISFLSVAVRMPGKKAMFEGPGILESFCEKIVLPNMVLRTFEEEMFEDDPFEYVRRDLLETAGGENETRRQSASDFTRALMDQFESRVTEIVSRYIQMHLQQYSSDPAANWQAKDTAVFLLTSIAARGSTAQHGVTSTNSLIDVVQFFSDHVVQDLQPDSATKVHPIIVADAIKFLYTFRSQLTKEQLVSVIPMLAPHLQSQSFVIHTYAAMTIERILAIRQSNNTPTFAQADIRPFAESLLVALFTTIERGQTPEEISKNDHLMRCVMRVIITARQATTPIHATVLQHLTNIMGEISKNPSNPKFNHYTFESMSALVRFVVAGTPSTLSEFEAALFPPFQYILAQDVSEFSPFVFQILSQLLELHTDALPEAYQALLPPILMANLWMQRGNIPALVRLLRAFLEKGTDVVVANNQLPAVRDIIRFLLPSKANDPYGCDLVEALFQYVPAENLQPYLKDIFVLLLTRLTQSKTEKFSQAFIKAVMLPLAMQKPGLGPDVIYSHVEALQAGFFSKMLEKMLPDIQKTPAKDRKVVMIGLAVLLTQSDKMLTPPGISAWPATFETFLKLLLLPRALVKNGTEAEEDEITVVDLEESGYQASFSKLGASEAARRDPLPEIQDAGTFLARELAQCSQRHPGRIGPLVQAVPQDLAQHFMGIMGRENVQLQ